MIDTAQLKENTDLVALVSQSVQLHKLSGAEYAGPCPRCGGDDRFHVDGKKGWWFCRQCYDYENGKGHDAIAYMQWLHGVGFKEACEMLGATPASNHRRAARTKAPLRPALPTAETPGDPWQEKAEKFVAYAERRLWENPQALAYLVDRGLSHETIRAARLGYNPKQLFRDPEPWGIADPKRRVWLPRGWTVPCWMDGALRYVKVRRLDTDLRAAAKYNEAHPGKRRSTDKYVAISGSKVGRVLYGLDDLPACDDLILAEGEFDALLLRQHLGSIAAVVATGAAKKIGGTYAAMRMLMYRRHWTALDTDSAGQEGSKRWEEVSARVRPLPPPDHDVTDAWRAGHDLVAWAVAGIGPADPEKRKAWLIATMERLDAGIVDPADEHDPDLRRWLACYDQMAVSEGWKRDAYKSRPGSISDDKGQTTVPVEDQSVYPKFDPTAPIEDMPAYLAQVCGGIWRQVSAPGDLAPDYAWCAQTYRWYKNDAGELVACPL